MYSIFTYIFGWFMGQILFNISAPWFAFSACLDGHSLVLLHLLQPQRCFRWWSDHSGWVHQAGAVSQVEVSEPISQGLVNKINKLIYIYIHMGILMYLFLCLYVFLCFIELFVCIYLFYLYVCIYVTLYIYIYVIYIYIDYSIFKYIYI